MAKTNKKENHIVLIILGIIIFILVIGLVVLIIKYEHLEDHYDHLEDMYNYQINNNTELNNNYISRDEALNIALNDLKATRNEVYDVDLELEYKARYQTLVYEISFNNKNYEYEYFIDATSGKILDYYKSWD